VVVLTLQHDACRNGSEGCHTSRTQRWNADRMHGSTQNAVLRGVLSLGSGAQ
jgi:hypothetical protein